MNYIAGKRDTTVATTDAESQSSQTDGPESAIIAVTGPKANLKLGLPSAIHKSLYGDGHRRASSHETGLSSEAESLHDIGKTLKPPREFCLKILDCLMLASVLFRSDCVSTNVFYSDCLSTNVSTLFLTACVSMFV